MNKLQKKLILMVVGISFFNKVNAQDDGSPIGDDGLPIGSSTGSTEVTTLVNPITGIDNIPQLIERILEIVLTVGVPLVALAVIYAGYKFIAAQGKPDKLTDAKQTLTYVLIGAGILLASWVIAKAIAGTICQIIGTCS